MSCPKHFADFLKVCSVLPVFAVVPAFAVVPEPVEGIVNNQTVSGETNGGYRLNTLDMDLMIVGSEFTNNSYDGWGAAAWATSGHDLTLVNSNFTGNTSESGGGAVGAGTAARMLKINGGTFTNNHAKTDGGAVASYAGLSIVGATFDGNTAQYEADKDGNYTIAVEDTTPIGGGAIALGAVSDATIAAIDTTTFKNNKSGTNGGAIGMRLASDADNSAAKLDIAATFEKNAAAKNGGAIYNTFYANNGLGKGNGVTVAAKFTGNTAGLNGGAIYNDGAIDLKGNAGGVMTLNQATFTGNSAGAEGGAIYNTGTLKINGGEFVGNTAKKQAGAIYNGNGGSLTIDGATFAENKSDGSFGAIVSGTKAVKTEILNSVFRDNSAGDVGALGLFSGATLTNVSFIDNEATSTANGMDGAGALFLGAVSKTVLTDVTFEDNESALRGGAISTRSADIANNKDARLDIIKSKFIENEAKTTGGAFDNYLYSSVKDVTAVYIADTSFTENMAARGGAIYNHGEADKGGNIASVRLENVSFVGNKASEQGGAIYNEAGAGIVMNGTNIFSGNIADKAKNDIYNDGAIKIEGGETSISGGIIGKGTLDIASGAVLNIGTATVNQSLINIDGTVNASVLNSDVRDNGKLFGEITGSGVINLDVSSVGTYKIFNNNSDIKINVGTAYLVENNGADGLVVSTKPIDMLVQEEGLSEMAAGALVGLANSSDKNVQRISLLAQQALNSGNTDLLEAETVKISPEDGVVVQAAATAAHNQVMSLAAGRMAGGQGMTTVGNSSSQYGSGSASYYGGGRSGGDENATQESGFWAQGLFNKSEYTDVFHGYTRGFAVGVDTLIDNKYTLGIGLAYSNSDIHSGSRDTDIDSKTMFIYGQYKPSEWFLNGAFAYTMSEYTENSNPFGGMLESTYDVDMFGLQMLTGYEFANGFVPSAGLRYLHTAQEEYSNGINTVKAMDSDYLTGVLGVSYSFLAKNSQTFQLRPELRAAATYDVVSDDSETTVLVPGVGSSYTIGGDSLSKWGTEFGIGLNMRYKAMEISLMYDLGLRQDFTSQTGMIKIRSSF